MYTELLQDKIIKKELNNQGVKDCQFDRFKLYCPSSYNKIMIQYKINNSVAVKSFKKAIIA